MAETVKKVVESVSEKFTGHPSKTLTRLTGCPVSQNTHSLTAGPLGPVLLQDVYLLEKLTHFTREKIPPRNVHALGTGAYGTFTVTNDISKYSMAKLFSRVNSTTDIFVRFSGVFTELGEPDTSRDSRGFAIKFYTEEGNWDLLTINTPVFNSRDPKSGPDAIHAYKRDPRTGCWHPTQTWDFVNHHPEALHQIMMQYSNRGGTPLSYRHMHAYGCNTFSFINAQNKRFWVKFHLLSHKGAKGMNSVQAKLVAGEDPNFLSRDLREAIERKDFPKWRFCCQIMPEEEGYRNPLIAFDCTKVWKHKDYPLIDIGVIELNRNPIDYFAEVEQVAFSPASIIPGIGFSPDKLLQGRLFLYDDAQHHRIGANFKQLYINRPHKVEPNTMHVGGDMQLEVKNKFPHYYPNSFGGFVPDPHYQSPPMRCDGMVGYYDYPGQGQDSDYYAQPADLLRVMSDSERYDMCDNIAASLVKVPDEIVRRLFGHFSKIDRNFAQRVEQLLIEKKSGRMKTEAERLVEHFNHQLQSPSKV